MDKEKIKRILNSQVTPEMIYVLCTVTLSYVSILLFAANAEAVATCENLKGFFLGSSNTLMFLSTTTVAILFGILICLTGRLFLSYCLMEILTLAWGIANKVVFTTRDQFISIDEFSVLGDALTVQLDKSLFFSALIVKLFVIGIVNGTLLWYFIRKIRKENRKREHKPRILLLRMGTIVLLLVGFILLHSGQKQEMLCYISSHRGIGCVAWFCQSLFGNTTEVVSIEETQDIYKRFAEQLPAEGEVSEKRPNIIVIMSEGFWDVNNLKEFVEVNESPMDKYYELAEDGTYGQVAVNIYGGGTIVSEFEFITGLNTRYMGGISCFGSYYANRQESMATYLKELGYYTMAMHPSEGDFYGRETGYLNMGFDAFYSDVDFLNQEMSHGYISDMSLTKEIIDRFEACKEAQPNQPVFTFAISVQNHVSRLDGFDENGTKNDCKDIEVTFKEPVADADVLNDVEGYYNGLKESCYALEALLNYFEEQEEETVVVFYGDHSPGFIKGLLDIDGREAQVNLYRTPYMIWTNYENDYESFGDISLSYLSAVLIDYLDLPKPNQYYMNRYMLEHYPINTRYEQYSLESLEDDRLLDMMSIFSTIDNRFPKVDMALPFWQVAE